MEEIFNIDNNISDNIKDIYEKINKAAQFSNRKIEDMRSKLPKGLKLERICDYKPN